MIRKMNTPKNVRNIGKMFLMFMNNDYKKSNPYDEYSEDELFSMLTESYMKHLAYRVAKVLNISAKVSRFFLGKFLTDKGDDIFDYTPISFWVGDQLTGIRSEDFKEYFDLMGVGYNNIINNERFKDIIYDEDKTTLVLPNWQSTYLWFSGDYTNRHHIGVILKDGQYNPRTGVTYWVLTHWYNEINLFDMIDSDSLNILKQKLIRDVDFISGLSHREEYNHYGMDIVDSETDIINVKENADTIMSIDDPYTFLILIDEGEDITGRSNLKNYIKWIQKEIFQKAYNLTIRSYWRPKLINEIIDLFDTSDVNVKDTGEVYIDVSKVYDLFIDYYIKDDRESPTDTYDTFKGLVYDLMNYRNLDFIGGDMEDVTIVPDELLKEKINVVIKMSI